MFAAGRRRRPAYGPPSTPVATYLTTPLTGGADAPRLDLDAVAVRTLRPVVEQIAARDPSFAGHNAAVQLAALGHGDVVGSYLGGEADRGETIFQPLLSGAGQAGDRQQEVQTLLPHVAALAGGQVQDHASQGILSALNDLLTGAADADTIEQRIWRYKDYLPQEGRVEWTRRLGTLKQQLPDERGADIDNLVLAILHCPD